jgi:transposase
MTPAVTGESQEVHSPPDGYQVAATSASLAMLLSTALGLWLARPQPRPALLATVPDQQRCRRPSPDTDRRAQRRALALQAVLDGTLTNEDAAAQLEVSARQLRRLLAAYRNGGVEALRHANAGRVPAHAVPGGVRDQVVELVRTRYVGLSQSELAQRLATEHGIYLHRTTVRRILLAAGLAQRCSDRGQW